MINIWLSHFLSGLPRDTDIFIVSGDLKQWDENGNS